jgi:hypothetical protein
MNLFQSANGAATFLILSALVAGLAKIRTSKLVKLLSAELGV